MKLAQGGVRPFVKLVMRQLQQAVVSELKAAGKAWDCSVGPDKMDAGPDEVNVTSVSKDGVFLCKEDHMFQIAGSYDSCDPTALQVVSPCDELAAAGFFDGQVVYVCRSATRALAGEPAKTFKCQTSPTTHPIKPFLQLFQCTVHSCTPVSFSVVANEHDPANAKFVASPGAASSPVKIWTVVKNTKKAGFFKRDEQKLSSNFDVTFEDLGSGLPSGIVSGRCYQLTCITTASFELMPELIALAADWNSDEKPLTLRRLETPQRCVRAHALKHHEKGGAASVAWASIKARNLSSSVNDFAKVFCSGSRDSVDVFDTETNGELLFNMMTFCKEFLYVHECLSANTCVDGCWTMRYSSFSLQPYWFNSFTSEVKALKPTTKLRELSLQATSTRNTLMHSDFEFTITEFEKTCKAFVDLLEEIVKTCKSLIDNGAMSSELRSDFALAIQCAQEKIRDIAARRLSQEAPTLQEQRDAMDLRKQYLMEKQRAEYLEQQNKSLLTQIDEKQEQIDGNRDSLLASLAQIASFSKTGEQDIVVSSQMWATGSRKPLLRTIRDSVVGPNTNVVCLHGQHGCGKSSALSQIIIQLRESSEENPLVLNYMFKFGDAASSVDVALASLCVHLWQKALGEVCDIFCIFRSCFLSTIRIAHSMLGHGHCQKRVRFLLEQRTFGQR